MKVYLINLDSEKERLAAADGELKRMGVKYARFSAVRGAALTKVKQDAAVNRFRWWCAVGRPCRVGEIGCALSHYGIYKQIEDRPICILEDDVVLDSQFKAVLEHVEKFVDVNKSQVVLLSNHANANNNAEVFSVVPSKSDMYAEAYVITPKAAIALLKANLPLQCPCDWWGRWARRGIIELYHAFPTVCSQDQAQYASGTVGVGCFKVSELNRFRWLMHKGKRLIGKIIDWILPL